MLADKYIDGAPVSILRSPNKQIEHLPLFFHLSPAAPSGQNY
ncbi:hypothetical protein OP10G_3328 [Fimbriimonas ginsengisoli Gsoil 348]|uniref:Uncharacterized protein n=1 Tax=Fimbriimonas ginsengisoli Gsoil 348 TaxID=661478 RepID=A0A068NTD4_FIMGI|nr:hypothetical protein OP10G_3328 [Fimbriimonas ginsengisoli Gsoil 348]